MRLYRTLVVGLVVSLSLSTVGCASWESMVREGDMVGACRAIEDIENPRRQAQARARASRVYTQESNADARVRILTAGDFGQPEVFDESRYRLIEVRSNADIEVRALVERDALWLAVHDSQLGLALIDAVEMRVSERAAPVSQSMSEAADRYMHRLSRGLVDSGLRKRDFGILAVCKSDVGECGQRRRALAELAQRFAASDGCQDGTCPRIFLLKHSGELASKDRVRVDVQSDFEGCSLSHATDVVLEGINEVDVGATTLADEWRPVDETLDDCTRREFLPPGCRAGLDRETSAD